MLFFVFGFPGGFTEWCAAVTAALARRNGLPVSLIEADTLDEVAGRAIQVRNAQAVVASHRPGGHLRCALIEARRNFLVVQEDTRTALLDLVLCRGIGLIEAVRIVASSCASLAGCARLPEALVLTVDRLRQDPAEAIAAIANHFGIALDSNAIAELVDGLVPNETRFRNEEAIDWWNRLDRAQREMVTHALLPYLDPAPSNGRLPTAWTGSLFFASDRPEVPASNLIDITGRAHGIVDGPYIVLPAGAWSLTLTLFCTRDAAEYEFQVDVVADGLLAAGKYQPQGEGTVELSLAFVIDDLTEHPVAIRISTVRAAFHGAISVVAATITSAATSSPRD